MADGIVELPMFGVNKSLNVMVCLGIVFLKEKSHVFKKMVGALLGFVGMVLVG